MLIMFRDGGPFMYLIVLSFVTLGAGAVVMTMLAVAARFKTPLIWPARILSFLGLGANIITLVLGAIGYWQGVSMLNEAIGNAPADMESTLYQHGMEVAQYPLTMGTILMFAGGVLWLLPLGIAMVPVSKNYDDLLDD